MSSYTQDETKYKAAVALCVEKQRENPHFSVAKYAREHGLSYQRLLNRIKGRQSRSDRKRTNQRLDNAQYEALFAYMDILDRLKVTPTAKMIKEAAEMILRHSQADPSQPGPKLGKTWAYRFMEQNNMAQNNTRQYTQVSPASRESQPTVVEDEDPLVGVGPSEGDE